MDFHFHNTSNMSNAKCAICGEEITGLHWIDEWGNRACDKHKREGKIKYCSSCHRIIGRYSTLSKKTGQIGFSLGNDRQVCGLCQETCVNSRKELDKSTDFVIKLLGRAGFKIYRDGLKSITVVTKEEMEKKSPNAQGLCVSHIWPDNPRRTTSEIFILNGMPKIQLESVLAHEMLHYWVFYNGVYGGEQAEGFCNIGSALVLNYYASRANSHLAGHLRENENTNSDYYYGYKFLEQKKKLQDLGWEKYINDILKRKKITP